MAMTTRLNRVVARRQLDRRLGNLAVHDLAVPRGGWLRAVREALGMPARLLAGRLDVSTSAIYSIERSERNGTIQLDTLRRAADALECDLVYALVPRVRLETRIRQAAETRARREIGAIDQTMRLEDQDLDAGDLDDRLADYVEALLRSGDVWS